MKANRVNNRILMEDSAMKIFIERLIYRRNSETLRLNIRIKKKVIVQTQLILFELDVL